MAFNIMAAYPERFIPVATSASTGLLLDELGTLRVSGGRIPQIEITAVGTDCVVAFGGSGVTATLTVDGTTSKRAAGMHYLQNGEVRVFNLPDTTYVYISTICAAGSGDVRLLAGWGEP